MKTHDLKTWPEFFEAVATGQKTFEVRKNDRDYQRGDVLMLHEWEPEQGYTQRWLRCRVAYVLHGPAFGIEAGFCVMSIKEVTLFPDPPRVRRCPACGSMLVGSERCPKCATLEERTGTTTGYARGKLGAKRGER